MKIIVYGSLRRNQGNSRWLTAAQLLAECNLDGYEMYYLDHGPAVVAGKGQVRCEIYHIHSSTLIELDEIKNRNKIYQRELIQTPYGKAWIYLYRLSVTGLTLIDSGDWLKRHPI